MGAKKKTDTVEQDFARQFIWHETQDELEDRAMAGMEKQLLAGLLGLGRINIWSSYEEDR